MAQAMLAIGGAIEVATPGEVKEIVEGTGRDILSGLPRPSRPLRMRVPASDVMPATGGLTLNFDGPPSGRVWNMVHVVVTGNDDRTAVVNAIAALYIGSANQPMLGMLVGPGRAVPTEFSYSRGMHWVHFGEELFLRVYGAAAAANLAAVATIHDYPDSAEEGGRI